MTYLTNVREDSNFVYGTLYELLELLNSSNLRFYVKNEKKVNLLREFKYQKKKSVEFVGTLDYFANSNDKESEFVLFPIVFNRDYEILYIGGSLFFKDNFSQYYKKEKYNYLELYIRNIEKFAGCNNNKNTNNNSSNGVDEEDEDDIRVNSDVLINLKNFKKLTEQRQRQIQIQRQRQINTKNKIFHYGDGDNHDDVNNHGDDVDDIIRTNVNSPYLYKNSDLYIKNRNVYTEGNESGKEHLGIYAEEYDYYNHPRAYQNSCGDVANHDRNILLYTKEEHEKENRDINITESSLNYNNETNQLGPKKLHNNNGLYVGEKREDLQNGNALYSGHYNFAQNENDINTNNNLFRGCYQNMEFHTHNSIAQTNKEFLESSKGPHHPGEDMFSKNVNMGLIGNVNMKMNLNEDSIKNEKEETCTIFSSGHHTSKGNRTYNEDRVINIENISEFLKKEINEINERQKNNESYDKEYAQMLMQMRNGETCPYTYCAIYDGHNGENAVNTVQKYLHLNIHFYFLNGNGMSNAIKCGFKALDKKLCECTSECEEDNHSNFSSGTTACVTVILKNMLYIGNIGDSRCVLSKNGQAVVLTVDHRSSVNKKELDRIINSGGTLDDEGYLGGCLGVCRGFGSFEKLTKIKLKGLICDPDIFQIKLTEDDEFLIICCDGIFDVMTSQEAVNTVRMSLIQNANAHVAAEGLCNLAYTRKSLDNLSAVVVVFQNPANKKKSSSNENAGLHSVQNGRVRRRIKFSALKSLLNL